jgi:CubicO group peptidase (beta-lactamase class C family)
MLMKTVLFSILLLAAGQTAQAQPAQGEAIARALEAAAAEGHFSGAVLVADRDRILFQGAFGQASREYDRPNTIDTQFNLASANKSMTAIAVMRLVEAGRISLDASVETYLGDRWLSVDIARRITVRQLLAHRSGLGDYLSHAAALSCGTPLRTLSDYRPLIAAARLDGEPGAASNYSNLGYLVLGAIIEEVTGESYDTHLRRTLLDPLGMARTQAIELDFGFSNLAQGYYRVPLVPLPEGRRLTPAEVEAHYARVGIRWRSNGSRCARPGTSAGGYYSTVGDMYRFARALQEGRLVAAATLTEMRRAQGPDNPNYGLGFTTRGGHIGHSGEAPGAETRYRILPDGHIVIVLSNMENGATEAYRRIETVLDPAAAR